MPDDRSKRIISDRWVLMLAVFLLSFSLLGLEISYTRLLSVAVSYHYLFLVLSIAMLGLALGAISSRYFRVSYPRSHEFGRLGRLSALFAFAALLPVAGALFTSAGLVLLSVLLFFPFCAAGVFLAQVFRAFPGMSNRLYGADLIGAGAGAGGTVLLLNLLGAPGSILFLGMVVTLVSLLLHARGADPGLRKSWAPLVNLAALAAMMMVTFSGSGTGIFRGGDGSKEIVQSLDPNRMGGAILDTRWSAFGRTDMVAYPGQPNLRLLYSDGTAGTPMYQFDGDLWNPPPAVAALRSFPGYTPLRYLQDDEKDNALVIGAGGGRDVLMALLAGVKNITAVEVNNDLVAIMQGHADYNGGLYTGYLNVSVRVDEGRNFVRRQDEKYDIIMMTMPVIKSAKGLDAYALTENYLLTTEAIQDYLDHLTDEGRLIVVPHSDEETLRLTSLALEAGKRRGISEQAMMERIQVIGSTILPTFVLKKTAFDPEAMVSIHRSLHEGGADITASYLPFIAPSETSAHVGRGDFAICSMLSPFFVSIGTGLLTFDDVEFEHDTHSLNLSPVSDDSPFFYNTTGIPAPVTAVFFVSAALVAVLVPASSMWWRGGARKGREAPVLPFGLLFLLLGAGFMLAEVSLIPRAMFLLGEPVTAVAGSLASLLVGAGLGSLVSGRFSKDLVEVVRYSSLAVAVVLAGYTLVLPGLFGSLIGLPFGVRLLATVPIMALPGFIMGFLFPTGLRLLKERGREDYVPWAWGINGAASVFGSVLAVMVAMTAGYSYALLAGAGLYFLIFLGTIRHRSRPVVPAA